MLRSLIGEVFDEIVDDAAQVDGTNVEREVAGFDATQLRDVIDEPFQAAELPGHDAPEMLIVFRREAPGIRLERLDRRVQPGERRAHLMRKIRNEVAADLLQAF